MNFGVERRIGKASTVVPLSIWQSAVRGLMQRIAKTPGSLVKSIMTTASCLSNVVEQVRQERWSLDACVGYARRNKLFTLKQITCTKTFYNMLWANKLPLSLFEVLQAVRQ